MHSEKRLFLGTTVGVALIFGGALWWHSLNVLPEIKVPNPTLPQPNAYDFHVRAAQAVTPEPRNLDLYPSPSDDVAKFYGEVHRIAAPWIAQNQPALKIMRQGFVHPYQAPPTRSFFADDRHYSQIDKLAKLLRVQCYSYLAQKKWRNAADCALDMLRICYDVQHGAPALSVKVGNIYADNLRRMLRDILPHLSAADCRALARRLEQIYASRVPLHQLLLEEKWTKQASLLKEMRDDQWKQLVKSIYAEQKRFAPLIVNKRGIMEAVAERTDAHIADAKLPYPQRHSLPDHPNPVVSLFTDYNHLRWGTAYSEAKSALLLTAIALHAFKLEHGSYPQNLADVKPNCLKTIPADPFGNGEPLRYKKQDLSYLLWSIGPDTKDDGGRLMAPVSALGIEPDSKGDIVFELNH